MLGDARRIHLLFNYSMNQGEYEALMRDPSKRIEGDITWGQDHGHPAALSFREAVESDSGDPISVKGYLNRNSRKLTFVILHRALGPIYRLDLGIEHPNFDGTLIGEKHKHPWVEGIGARDAYEPEDITATVDDPVRVWQQFCEEANLTHSGAMGQPPSGQMGMML